VPDFWGLSLGKFHDRTADSLIHHARDRIADNASRHHNVVIVTCRAVDPGGVLARGQRRSRDDGADSYRPSFLAPEGASTSEGFLGDRRIPSTSYPESRTEGDEGEPVSKAHHSDAHEGPIPGLRLAPQRVGCAACGRHHDPRPAQGCGRSTREASRHRIEDGADDPRGTRSCHTTRTSAFEYGVAPVLRDLPKMIMQ